MEIISRVDARKLGLKRFYTGKPCPQGHIAERLVSNGTCVVCTREKADAWALRVSGTIKPCKYGHVSKRTTNGACMECERIGAAKELAEAPDVVRARGRRSYQNNAEKRRSARRARGIENRALETAYTREYNKRPHVKLSRNEKMRRRYQEDLEHRLSVTLRNGLNAVVSGKIKGGSAVRDLGCSLAHLRVHIEQQFHSGMSWENWGTIWELDHRDPLAMHDLTNREELLRACNYANLQPLLISDHWAKTEQDKRRIKLAKAARRRDKPKI